jgi:predicted dehydrogenase
MSSKLRVGIIGVNADRGWAGEAHVPAVQALEGLELAAVAARSQETADAAAAAFGVDRAYGDARGLIDDPDLDIVTVAASVPAHRELLIAALHAGRHVVTEWPVGTSTAETEQIATTAARGARHAAVGLQSRMNPAAIRARELIAAGEIGRVLTATVYSSTAGFGREVAEDALYLERPETAMNLLTIQTAHTIDFAVHLVGQLTSLAAMTTIQYPELAVGDPPRSEPRTIPDHILVHGRLDDGGALAIQVAGGRPANHTPFTMEITGENGVITLTGGAPRGFQAGLLAPRLNGQPIPVDRGETERLPDSVANVAGVYAALRDDITTDSHTAPSFDDAVRLAHLVDDLLTAADTGSTVTPTAEWP